MGVFLESAVLRYALFVPCYSQLVSVVYQRLFLFVSSNNHADTEILGGRISLSNSREEKGIFSSFFSLL